MINITLHVRGMKATAYAADIRMRESLDAFALADAWDKAQGVYSEALVDDVLRFIVRCFGRQFAVEDLLDGYEGSFYALAPNFLRAVIGYVAEQMTDFPPKAATTKAKARG